MKGRGYLDLNANWPRRGPERFAGCGLVRGEVVAPGRRHLGGLPDVKVEIPSAISDFH